MAMASKVSASRATTVRHTPLTATLSSTVSALANELAIRKRRPPSRGMAASRWPTSSMMPVNMRRGLHGSSVPTKYGIRSNHLPRAGDKPKRVGHEVGVERPYRGRPSPDQLRSHNPRDPVHEVLREQRCRKPGSGFHQKRLYGAYIRRESVA